MSLTNNTIWVITVILLAGILGGGINCLQARKADEPLPKNGFYYFLLSIAAAFAVPLFLSLTKSSLLKDLLGTTPAAAEDWFILFAICLVAAIYAQSFLESVSNQLMKRMDHVEQQTKKNTQVASAASGDAVNALNVAEANSEQIANQTADPTAKMQFATKLNLMAAAPVKSADPTEQKVLDALKSQKYPLGRRSLGGIVLETKLNRADVTAILNKLIADGAVEEVPGAASGTAYYSLRTP
jgi:hypothetical protein